MDRRRPSPWFALVALTTGCSGGAGTSATAGSATAEATTTGGEATTTATSDDTTAATTTSSTTTMTSTSSETTGTTGAPSVPGEDATVPVFAAEHIYFGDQNRRQVDVEVTLPEEGAYDSIVLHLALGCPNGLCDHWDRYGTFGIVLNPGTDDEGYLELSRFITAYRVATAWDLDLTALRPVLKGTVTMRVFIDTWVGPGHPDGDGWLVDATLDFHGGVPLPEPIAVLPLWYQTFNAGDPAQPIDGQVPVMHFSPPAEATSFTMRSHITGHGFGNTDNCAEFCPLVHGYQFNEDEGFSGVIWRDNCAETPVKGQQGTWTYPRAGWCPGADVLPWEFDVTAAIKPGEINSVLYALQDYENTCRPDAEPCKSCAGATCDDGHSLPYFYMSSVVIGWR